MQDFLRHAFSLAVSSASEVFSSTVKETTGGFSVRKRSRRIARFANRVQEALRIHPANFPGAVGAARSGCSRREHDRDAAFPKRSADASPEGTNPPHGFGYQWKRL